MKLHKCLVDYLVVDGIFLERAYIGILLFKFARQWIFVINRIIKRIYLLEILEDFEVWVRYQIKLV